MKRLDPLTVALAGTNLIEASAGTGKTYTIALLVLRFVVERALPISRILVVTYTIAATAELRSRIRSRLRDALDALDGAGRVGDDLLRGLIEKWRTEGFASEARLRLEIALREFDEAPIFTIHGFCQKVLLEHAFESGVAFATELVPVQAPLERELVFDLWARALAAEPPEIARRVAPKVRRKDLTAIVKLALSKRRARFLPEEPTDDRVRILRWIVDETRAEARRRKEATSSQSFDDLLYDLDAALASDEGSGGHLAGRLREQLSAALIDEFQDTDAIQLDIFRRIFAGHAPLFLIGDPKQSIYWFRGADLYAYLDARKRLRPLEHTLGSNWRSDPGLVAAVNALFSAHPAPFLVEGVDFDEALAEKPRRIEGLGVAPLRFLFVERKGRAGKSGYWAQVITKNSWANEFLARAVAGEVRRLLDSNAKIEGKAIGPGDVAILCRTNKLLQEVREALRGVRIPAVIQGATSVFEDPEAPEMERVVAALADPTDPRIIRSALATSLLGLSGDEIHRLGDDEARWDEWAERFRGWHETWLRRGFAAAFRELLAATGAYGRLAGAIGGERRLTNFLHLAELLQAEELASRRGPVALGEWLRGLCDSKDLRLELGEDVAQVRLESDVHAVKLVTIHKAKGLEWPIVLCPDLWQGADLIGDEATFPRHHRPIDGGGTELVIDLGSPDQKSAAKAARRERIEEQIRLLYVAITRAKHHCTVFWGHFYEGETSPLAILLHLRDGFGGAGVDLADLAKKRFDKLKDDEMCAVLEELGKRSRKNVGVERLVEQRVFGYGRPPEDVGPLEPRRLARAIRDDWKTSSFTALVRVQAGTPLTRLDEEGIDRDQTTAEEDEPRGPAAPEIALHDFPAGPNAGNCLHLLLEKVDFARADEVEIERTAAGLLPRFGLSIEWAPRLGSAVARLLATPLRLGGDSFTLRDVGRRRSEMKFFLPVGGLDPSGLGEAFRRHGAPATDPAYAGRLRTLGFTAFAGFLQGAIDLVFEHAGRWWVVDWKSNHLGVRAKDYAPERLVPEMSRHDYFLQAHLYALGVHRHLRVRLPAYDYENAFGGVAYLFVRGIDAALPAGTGVFFDRPPRALIEDLSAILDRGRRAG